MSDRHQSQAIVLAGPNGAGKSTSRPRLLPASVPFVNADDIAREMGNEAGPVRDLAAGRVLVQELRRLVRDRENFGLETNLANRTLSLRIPEWQAAGYRVSLFFIWLPSADLSVARVAARVRSGGHDVPEAVIRRRYVAGLRHFFDVYQPLVNDWRMYDNARPDGPRLIARGVQRFPESDLWHQIHKFARGSTQRAE